MVGAVSSMVFSGLKVLRKRIAVKLPEIEKEWPDEMLQAPAHAVVPVFKRYADTLFSGLGQYPELGMLAFTMLPMVMGYLAAADKQDARTVDEVKTA
jgi:hypothetical protein